MSSDARREQIIEAAIAVFGAKGYVGTTTDDVARAASISQPYVVRLFGTKEKLFLAALDDALETLMRAFVRAQTDGRPGELEEKMGNAYLELLEFADSIRSCRTRSCSAHTRSSDRLRERDSLASGAICGTRPACPPMRRGSSSRWAC